MSEHKLNEFVNDYAKFYDVEQKQAQKLDTNKLYQASRGDKGFYNPTSNANNGPDLSSHSKTFFGGMQEDTESYQNRNNQKILEQGVSKPFSQTVNGAFMGKNVIDNNIQ